jgi:RES domain-containing protein
LALDVEATIVEGRWWRHVPAGADRDHRPDPAGDNRWQQGTAVDALYLADSPEGAWAEWYRHLAEAALPPLVALPRDLWHYQVATLLVADLSDLARLRRVGLPAPQPGRRSWPPFQAVGETLHQHGWRGLLAPSAARPASRVLVVFLPGLALPAEVLPTGSIRIAQPPPPPIGMRT